MTYDASTPPSRAEEPPVYGADTLCILAGAPLRGRLAALSDRLALAKTSIALGDADALNALVRERAVDLLLVDARKGGIDLAQLDVDALEDTDVVALTDTGHTLEGVQPIAVAPGAEPDEAGIRMALESVLYRRTIRRLALMLRRQHEQSRLLAQTRKGLSAFYHDINNPLAILSGNAQLLLEIGRQMELGTELMDPLSDVEESSRRLFAGLQEIVRLKETIANSGLEFSGASADT